MSGDAVKTSEPPVERKGAAAPAGRIVSIDSFRGFVMLVMIFVNDLSDVSNDIVPPWMKHYRGENGMTFVDLVFPGFLFIVGMSIPFALGGRLAKGESPWKTLLHVVTRTVSLLFVGILMVNGIPDSDKMGWSGQLWELLVFGCAIIAFCEFSPMGKKEEAEKRKKLFKTVSKVLQLLGLAGLVYLAFVFRNKNGNPLVTISPFYIHHIWYGILGYIAWAYLMSSLVFLIFRNNVTAILACAVLMMCLYPASKLGMFDGTWIAKNVNIGIALGSRAAIAALGMLLGAMLYSTATREVWRRIQFAVSLTAGYAAAALLLYRLYGISKENGTPSWCLWGCVVTTVAWLAFYVISDLRPIGIISRPFAIAGQNVLLPYLISEMFPSLLSVIGLDGKYAALAEPSLASAVIRSVCCAIAILCFSTWLNRRGFRLRL